MAETEIKKINGRTLCDTAARTSLQEQAKKIDNLEKNGTGTNGYTPVKGTDYWTPADRTEIISELSQTLTPEVIGAASAEEVASLMQAETTARENAITDLKSQGVQQTPLFAESKEWLNTNGDTSKIYLLPDGYLYAYKNVSVRNELYVASEAEINMRHSHSASGLVAANGYVITGYIDIAEIMTRTEPKLSIVFGTNKKSTARITYYDTDKNYLTKSSGGNYNSGGAYDNEWADDYHCTVYLGMESGEKCSYYSSIAYVRLEAIINSSPATEADKSVFSSISDPDAETSGCQWTNTGHAFVPADYEDRIIEIEEDVSGIQDEILSIKNDVGSLTAVANGTIIVPAYWETMVEEKTAVVKALQEAGGKDCICFAWASDTHIPDNSGGRTTDLGKVMAKMLDNCEIPFTILSGDIGTRGSYATEAQLIASHKQLLVHLSPLWGTDRLLMALGNHDGTWGDSTGYYRHQYTPERLWQVYFRGQALDCRRVFSENGLYYYVDIPAQKVRFIILNTHFGGEYAEDENDWAVNNRFATSCYGQEQLDWLADVALDMPEGYGAILTAHVPPQNVNGSTTPYTVDHSQFKGIINAYCSRTTFSGSYTAGVDGWTNSTVNVDFSSAKGEIIAMFTGHIHYDGIYTETMACPIVTITAAGATGNNSEQIYDRPSCTDQETSFDVVTINRAARKINCTRIGAGSDRETSY